MISCLESPAWQFEIISHHSILGAPFSGCHTLCYVLVTRLWNTWTALVQDQRRSAPKQTDWFFLSPLDISLEHQLQKSKVATLHHLWSLKITKHIFLFEKSIVSNFVKLKCINRFQVPGLLVFRLWRIWGYSENFDLLRIY